MTCISFEQIHEGRNASYNLDQTNVSATLVQVWRAETDDNTDDATIVAQHANCPSLGTAHPNNAYAFLKDINFRNESFSKKIWIVTLTYSTTEYEQQDNPLNTSARITWRSEQYQRPAEKDKSSQAIVNSAGDYYDPPPERDDSRWVVTVVKNLSTVPIWLLDFQDSINSVAFIIDGLTVPARCAKVQNIEISDWQYSDSTAYRQITIGITIKKDNYTLQPLDQGFHYKDGSDRKECVVKDKNGVEVPASSPQLLDGSGGQLASPSPSTAVFNTHYVYEEKNFSVLPLV